MNFTIKIHSSNLSDIWEFTDLKNNKFVVKIPLLTELAIKEYKILDTLKDVSGIIKLICVKEFHYKKKILIGLVFNKFGCCSRTLRLNFNLFYNLNAFKCFTHKILTTVNDIHKKGVIHCDIKPTNILVDSKFKPVLADFGNSIHKSMKSYSCYRTSEQYRDHERFVNKMKPIDEYHDVYSLGCLFYFYYAGEELFSLMKNNDEKSLAQSRKISEGRITLSPKANKFPNYDIKSLQNLINSMTTFKKTNRLNISECLKHDFFKKKCN